MGLQLELTEYGELTEALLDSLNRQEMEGIIQALGERPGTIGAEKINDPEYFRNAVGHFSRRNQADQLIIQARVKNPGNPKLFAFAQRYRLAAEFPPEAARPAELEALIRKRNPYLDYRGWLTQLTALEGRVCLVKAGAQTGTGFLVGPDAIMTNYHVMREVIDGQANPRHVRFTFDTSLTPGGVAFRPADDWLIDASPTDPRDGHEQVRPADVPPDRLDYAVVRVAGRPGESPVGGGDLPGAAARPQRGWIALSDLPHDYSESPGMVIAQHPGGGPLKLAVDPDAFVALNPRGTRVYYAANTEAGSSGSPCFDMERLTLIALHQAHVPRLQLTRAANSGVPIDAIYRLLDERGKLPAVTGRS